jgi:hypothetical protein
MLIPLNGLADLGTGIFDLIFIVVLCPIITLILSFMYYGIVSLVKVMSPFVSCVLASATSIALILFGGGFWVHQLPVIVISQVISVTIAYFSIRRINRSP